MSSIQFVNLGEVLAGIEARKKKLENIPKLAAQMGVLATNEIHPLTHKKSTNWDSSIHAEVSDLGGYKYELWVGSRGAFSGKGYNYGARQERLYHPIEVGCHRAQPVMVDLWNEKMKGIVSVNAAGMSDFAGLDVGSW
jgi:hypothetical protein